MSKLHSHLSSAVTILTKYDGSQPFFHHLKRFFSSQKKFGSRDRKIIAGLCYAYFRTGHALKNADKSDKILAGLFLLENTSNEFLQQLRPEWNEKTGLPLKEKMIIAGIRENEVFPFAAELSAELDPGRFTLSFLKQPRFFLRARPGRHAAVLQKLNDEGISYETTGEDCIALPGAINAEILFKINSEVVVQDMNSQRVLDHLKTTVSIADKKPSAWDCCAASGGKSILLYDRLKGNVRLTVSDIRESILLNLRQRLEEAGISIHKSFVTDLGKKGLKEELFDIIICDVPCTGSGTWSRTPDQLYYFHRKKISEYAALQKKIISNTMPSLAANGLFFYITCSVFREENDAQVEFIKISGIRLLHMEYLKGYDQFADTMFVAVFSK